MGENIGTRSRPVYTLPHFGAEVLNPCFRCEADLYAESTEYSTFCEGCILHIETIVAGQAVITDFGGLR